MHRLDGWQGRVLVCAVVVAVLPGNRGAIRGHLPEGGEEAVERLRHRAAGPCGNALLRNWTAHETPGSGRAAGLYPSGASR